MTPVEFPHGDLFKKGIILFTVLVGVLVGPLLRKPLDKWMGIGLNGKAWRASFQERALAVPPGPREGFWGIHLAPVPDPVLGIRLPPRKVPGMFDIDERGIQQVSNSRSPEFHLLILGGSVAAGAYASSLHRTYFYQLVERLGFLRHRVLLDVLATGAWTSANTLSALTSRGLALKPDYVIFLEGLNDVTLYDKVPEETRVHNYLDRMRQARDAALAQHIKVIFAPQPFLPDKRKSALEKLILYETTQKPDQLVNAYNNLRAGLQALQVPGQVYYIDTSLAFNRHRRTLFADIWHFSDVGQALLGKYLAIQLDPILTQEERRRR